MRSGGVQVVGWRERGECSCGSNYEKGKRGIHGRGIPGVLIGG